MRYLTWDQMLLEPENVLYMEIGVDALLLKEDTIYNPEGEAIDFFYRNFITRDGGRDGSFETGSVDYMYAVFDKEELHLLYEDFGKFLKEHYND